MRDTFARNQPAWVLERLALLRELIINLISIAKPARADNRVFEIRALDNQRALAIGRKRGADAAKSLGRNLMVFVLVDSIRANSNQALNLVFVHRLDNRCRHFCEIARQIGIDNIHALHRLFQCVFVCRVSFDDLHARRL